MILFWLMAMPLGWLVVDFYAQGSATTVTKGLRPAGKANNQVATMTAARPAGSDGKGRDAGWSITARANVSRARRAGKVTLPAMKFLDNQETDDQTDGPAQAGGSPSGAAVHRRNRNNRAA